MIRDQRHMCGPRPLSSAASVRAFWAGFAAKHNRTLVETGDEVTAYINQGRWLADCPRCNGGIACWPAHMQGACLDCCSVYVVRFPDPETIAEVERALLHRPEPNRNWTPWREQPADLRRENIVHGVPLETPDGMD